MASYDYRAVLAFEEQREKERKERIQRLSGPDKVLAEHIAEGKQITFRDLYGEDLRKADQKPSLWFCPDGNICSKGPHQALLDVFVPKDHQHSYLYIIDKLNRFPFTRGSGRRCVRTAGYAVQIPLVFSLLKTYELLVFCGGKLEDYLYRRLDNSMLEYIHYCGQNQGFSYLYAAEIDQGNDAVFKALKDLMLSENNTACLEWNMILGILQSDSEELQELLGKLLVAASLQEGLRQAVCENMDSGTPEAFLRLLKVVEDHDLLRFSAVKRAVFVWIGIFDGSSVERISKKLLHLMGECLRDRAFCESQLSTEDAVAINTALWALGFYEAEDAVKAIEALIDHGTRHQKLAASFYNRCLYSSDLRRKAAKKVLAEHGEDLELASAYLDAFSSDIRGWLRESFEEDHIYYTAYTTKLHTPKKPVLTRYYKDRQEAEKLYACFQKIADRLPANGIRHEPFVFSWFYMELHPSEVLAQMAFLAWLLEDEEKITAMAACLGEITDGNLRVRLMNLLLCKPSCQEQRKLVIGYMGNTHTQTSCLAVQIVNHLTIQKDEYLLLEDMLRFKRAQIRGTLITLLMKQTDDQIEESLKRLLSDKKEEKRCAGLDMLMRLSRDPERAAGYERVRGLLSLVKKPTDKEKILIRELEEDTAEQTERKKGYGIYNPEALEELLYPLPKRTLPEPEELFKICMPVSEQEAFSILHKADRLFEEYKDYEYTASDGEKCLLGNDYRYTKEGLQIKGLRTSHDRLDAYPLPELFRDFYEKEIRDYRTFTALQAVLLRGFGAVMEAEKPYYERMFGKMPFTEEPLNLDYLNQIRTLWAVYYWQFLDQKALFEAGLQVVASMSTFVSRDNCQFHYQSVGWRGHVNDEIRLASEIRLFYRYFEGLPYWETDEQFVQAFDIAWEFEKRCREGRARRDFYHLGSRIGSELPVTGICPYWFLKAFHMGLITKDSLYKAVMEYFAREDVLKVLCEVKKGEAVKPLNGRIMNIFFGKERARKVYETKGACLAEDAWEGALIRKLYDQIVPVMVDAELRRGEAETEFSWDMRGITYICGTKYLVRILMALGKDKLERDAYYSWYYGSPKVTKREVLCQLLKASYPAACETGADLKEAAKDARIREDRFVEAAMYAPQWIHVIQEYLGWAGLKSGCYYFMAHMNERFDDQKKAVIARYTPLTPEELQEGAFDAVWFEEAFGLLGEERFDRLYEAAKYISYGQKHSRARKYADAARGKVSLPALKEEIEAKRNKDLLMSYGLVPFREDREQDMLERYQFIEQYRKESRQFGAQRRAGEGKAADIALVNLSVRAGYQDVTRLKLTMETRLVAAAAILMEWTQVEDMELCLHVDEDGKSRILCRKDGKELKSVPSRIGKHPHVLQLKGAHKSLKEQYQRTRRMMEEAMENGDLFRWQELYGLFCNPVVGAILRPLVFLYKEKTGFLALEGKTLWLEQPEGERIRLADEDMLQIAHPLHLYESGVWHKYQKHMFEQKIRQPFKQVFRELYVKLPEELDQKASRIFAGNQIQPQKTVGCLRERRWVADYEEGLQKIYYKENIVARIYAMADWFSPSDIEAPTLEWVEFFDRKSFEPLTIQQVPKLIYSEVMRDVDLAVSVAHAGGVDPETSHSTIDMRRRIAELNLSLFGLKNVTLKDSHALIQGKRAVYNVHLGSGVVHQEGGAMLHILPVHSQKRGRIFLPFVDEDPKTSEIMSKIILLAEDQKLKDPTILSQIR